MGTVKIAIHVPSLSMFSAVAGLVDIFWIVNNIIRKNNDRINNKSLLCKEFEILLVSHDGNNVKNAHNNSINVDVLLNEVNYLDFIIIPGMMLNEYQTPLLNENYYECIKWINAQYYLWVILCGVYAGTFFLGDAGLINGKSYATTWWLCHTFQKSILRRN
ncbi:MAG TPA: hypothetical protein ACQGQH_06695 [Xylella sp.]